MHYDFVPSSYSYQSYGETTPPAAEDVVEEKVPLATQITEWVPAIKTIFGLDDPQDMAIKLENRLRDLQSGNASQLLHDLVPVRFLVAQHGHDAQLDKPLAELGYPRLHTAPSG